MTGLLLLVGAADHEVHLTLAGAVIMVLCIGMVLILTVFCMSRVLRERQPEMKHHAPLDIDTHDREV